MGSGPFFTAEIAEHAEIDDFIVRVFLCDLRVPCAEYMRMPIEGEVTQH